MKKVFLLITLAFTFLTGAAQDYSWMDSAPGKYLPQTTKIIVTRTSPCNQGEEAFMDFIPRFRTDAKFRNSRLRFSEDMDKMSFEVLGMGEMGYGILKARKINQKCDQSYGTWYMVSENEVCFVYNDVLPCDDVGGGGVYARFQRIDGKWYCTGCLAAG